MSEWIGWGVEREDGLERLVLIGRFSFHLNLELRLDAIGSISVFCLEERREEASYISNG